jgi:hypothetical protein
VEGDASFSAWAIAFAPHYTLVWNQRRVRPMPRYPAAKVPPSCEKISIELAQQVLAESWGNISVAADGLAFQVAIFGSWFE